MAVETGHAQRARDARVAELVRAGSLRVGIGLGTPALATRQPQTGEVHGPAVELGRALAMRIGIDFVPVEYPRPGAVIDGARTGAWDVAFLVIDPDRDEDADFSYPYMQTDFTYLVPADSPIHDVADADQPGVRIAVPRGDASDLRLTRMLGRGELVRTETIAEAVDLVRRGVAHARAAPRPILLAESAELPGSRVLEDGFALVSYAAWVPKDRAGLLAYVNEFIEEMKASGMIGRTIEAAGLRGVRVAPPGDGGGL